MKRIIGLFVGLCLVVFHFNITIAGTDDVEGLFLKAKETLNLNIGDSYTASKEGLEKGIKEMRLVLESGCNNEVEGLVLLRNAYNSLAYIYYPPGSEERKQYIRERAIINNRLVELEPENVEILYQYTRTEEDIDLKLKAYRKIIKINPDYVKARYALGKRLIDKGMVEEGIKEISETLRRSKGREYEFYRRKLLGHMKAKGLHKERDVLGKEFREHPKGKNK